MPAGTRVAEYRLLHRHIQFALKYARLGARTDKYKTRLKNLLANYLTWTATVPGAAHQRQGSAYPGTGYSFCKPRIANGRFLLFNSGVFYPDEQGQLTKEDTLQILLCPHQIWSPLRLRMLETARANYDQLTSKNRERVKGLMWLEGNALTRAMMRLIRDGGGREEVSCGQCPSEIIVEMGRDNKGRNKLAFRAWHDFGPEGSPVDAH